MDRLSLIAVMLWAGLVATGFVTLYTYASEPGRAGSAQVVWPEPEPMARDASRWTLLLFVHPRCPCTRATMGEFARLHAVHRDAIDPVIVMYHPVDENGSWADGVLRDGVARLPGSRLILDPGGAVAERFGVRTSGHVLAYSPEGRLGFSGGITTSRGHEGSSDGRALLAGMLRGGEPAGLSEFRVFGCPITHGDAEASCGEGDAAACAGSGCAG